MSPRPFPVNISSMPARQPLCMDADLLLMFTVKACRRQKRPSWLRCRENAQRKSNASSQSCFLAVGLDQEWIGPGIAESMLQSISMRSPDKRSVALSKGCVPGQCRSCPGGPLRSPSWSGNTARSLMEVLKVMIKRKLCEEGRDPDAVLTPNFASLLTVLALAPASSACLPVLACL